MKGSFQVCWTTTVHTGIKDKKGCGGHRGLLMSDEIATSVGKSEFCIHTGDAKRLLSAHFHSLPSYSRKLRG